MSLNDHFKPLKSIQSRVSNFESCVNRNQRAPNTCLQICRLLVYREGIKLPHRSYSVGINSNRAPFASPPFLSSLLALVGTASHYSYRRHAQNLPDTSTNWNDVMEQPLAARGRLRSRRACQFQLNPHLLKQGENLILSLPSACCNFCCDRSGHSVWFSREGLKDLREKDRLERKKKSTRKAPTERHRSSAKSEELVLVWPFQFDRHFKMLVSNFFSFFFSNSSRARRDSETAGN